MATAVAVLLAVGAAGGASSQTAMVLAGGDPQAHFDPAEGLPLDLFGARFGQTADRRLTLVLRIRLEPTADGRLQEKFCFSHDGRTCDAGEVTYVGLVPQHDP